MSGLMDKAKEAVHKMGSKPGADQKVDNYANKGIDQATDRAGLGDKYDSKIDKVADVRLDIF